MKKRYVCCALVGVSLSLVLVALGVGIACRQRESKQSSHAAATQASLQKARESTERMKQEMEQARKVRDEEERRLEQLEDEWIKERQQGWERTLSERKDRVIDQLVISYGANTETLDRVKEHEQALREFFLVCLSGNGRVDEKNKIVLRQHIRIETALDDGELLRLSVTIDQIDAHLIYEKRSGMFYDSGQYEVEKKQMRKECERRLREQPGRTNAWTVVEDGA